MGIYKYLDCSTSHITSSDSFILKKFAERDVETSFLPYSERSYPPIHVIYYPEGFVVFVPDDDVEQILEECKQDGLSDSFAKIIKLAASENCPKVFIDADGAEIEGLDRHHW